MSANTTTSTTSHFQKKSKGPKKKARNPLNQETLNKLLEISTEERFVKSDNYKKLFGKAMKSLSQTDEYIETYDNAIKLAGVGKFLAQLIMKKKGNGNANDGVLRKDKEDGNSAIGKNISNSDDEGNTTTSKKVNTQLTPNTASRMLRKCSTISSTESNISRKEVTMELVTRDSNATREELSSYRQWNIVLLLDNREHYANHVQAKLLQEGIECEQRALPIGDMLWIARGSNHISKTGSTVEVILGTIVERKTAGDLASSLFGTRYDEQRLRLRYNTVGIHQVIFLIEAKTLKEVQSCPAKTLRSCIESTRVHMGFSILNTDSLDHTCRSLKGIHAHIHRKVPPNTPPTPKTGKTETHHYLYPEFKLQIELSRDRGTKSVQAIFGAMIKQIDGMSHKKVQAFIKVYPTPFHFYKAAAASASTQHFRNSVADIALSDKERLSRIGDKTSQMIIQVFLKYDCEDDSDIVLTVPSASLLLNARSERVQQDETVSTVSRNMSDTLSSSSTKNGTNASTSLSSPTNMEVIELD